MAEPESHRSQPQRRPVLHEFIGESAGVSALRSRVAHLLDRQTQGRALPSLLLQGETGTGKGLLARTIHRASVRAARPFMDIDCAAIPETLLEAELFGVERGAFTDARHTKQGLFQAAAGGTILLDEVGLLPRSLQGKLLKVVEERTVRRLGSTRAEVVDVWILAATNVDLAAAVRDGGFREDLYHRLAAVTLTVPPLRARAGDILLLAEHCVARTCSDYGLPPKVLAPETEAAILAYQWPGNVRELANRLERAVLLSGEESVVTAALLDLPVDTPHREAPPAQHESRGLRSMVERVEREQLAEALREEGGNISRAAARLALPRNTFRYRLIKLGMMPETGGQSPVAPIKPPVRMDAGPVRRPSEQPIANPPADRPTIPPAEAEATLAAGQDTRIVSLLAAELRGGEGQPAQGERLLEIVAAKVHGFGGRVEVIGGRRLVATFGVYPCEDATGRAAHAAIASAMAVERPPLADHERPSIRVAVHACEASVRRVKTAFAMDAEQRQQAERVLEGMLGVAEAGDVLICQVAARRLRGGFWTAPVAGADGVPGFPSRLVSHDGSSHPIRPLPATPFVGRRVELDVLDRLFDWTEMGHGQVVGIVGEPGAGRSRLLEEFAARLARRRVAHRRFRLASHGPGLADLTVVEALRQAWQIAPDDGRHAIVSKVRRGLENLDMDPDRWGPCLAALFGVQTDGTRLDPSGREDLKRQVFHALRRVAAEAGKRAPLVIEVDDLHAFGKTASEFLNGFVESVSSARILLLTTYQPHYRPPWVGRSYVTQLSLPPLSRAESLALVRSVLPPGRFSESLGEAILARAEGNALFLEEIARSVASVSETEAGVPVPETVRALVEDRVSGLGADARRVLRVVSALGRRVPARLLDQVGELGAPLAEGLEACRQVEFLHEELVDGEPVYVFKSALVWEVIHQGLSPEERRALRGAAGLPD